MLILHDSIDILNVIGVIFSLLLLVKVDLKMRLGSRRIFRSLVRVLICLSFLLVTKELQHWGRLISSL